jgi:hypothetical protein
MQASEEERLGHAVGSVYVRDLPIYELGPMDTFVSSGWHSRAYATVASSAASRDPEADSGRASRVQRPRTRR